jgi:hypothetical protein
MSVPRMSRTIAIVSAGVVCATVASAQEPAAVVAWQSPAAAAQAGKPGVAVTTPKPGTWPGATTYGFSVVLVLGDMQGGTTAETVPAAARKALADMKDFLPYKSYRLLDSAWVLGSGSVSTRLRGLDDQEYNLNLSGGSSREDPKTLRISFQLRDTFQSDDIGTAKFAPGAEPAAVARARKRVTSVELRAKLEQQIHDLTLSRGANHPEVLKAKAELDQLNRQLAELGGKGGAMLKESRAAACCIISTGFTMEIGETVVVGTSRLRGGDKALIALLTAVPRSK